MIRFHFGISDWVHPRYEMIGRDILQSNKADKILRVFRNNFRFIIISVSTTKQIVCLGVHLRYTKFKRKESWKIRRYSVE